MKAAIFACLFVVIAVAAAIRTTNTRDMFDEWTVNFDISFNSKFEEQRRFNIFKQNLEIIEELQSQTNQTQFGLTRFAHLTPEEFAATYLSTEVPYFRDGTNEAERISKWQLRDLPDAYDWTEHKPAVVTPVKDQGQCGSCWAFSATGNIEGQWALAGNPLTSLSEQHLVDCDHVCIDGVCDGGCHGGLMANAFTYIIKNGGIDTETSYPYQGKDLACRKTDDIGAKIVSYKFIPKDTEQIRAYLTEHGPLAVAVDATTFQFYRGGILTSSCGTRLNHGVLLIGYGTDNGTNFWRIKNSWGTSWGEKGFIRIARTKNYCGVEEYVITAQV